MEKFPSMDEAKMDILTENLDSVFCNLSIPNILKAFCLNPHEETLKLPSLDRHTNLKSYFLQLAGSLGMNTTVASDGSLIVTKVSEPTCPRTNILKLAATTESILSEYMRCSQDERDVTATSEAQKTSNVSFSSIGSGSPGRLSLTVSIPIIGKYLGEEPEAVYTRRKLPIYKYRTEILRNIDQNVVMMVTGDPGSGKTTQVPQYILEQYGKSQNACRILSVLPRRISAQAAAERVRYERGVTAERLIGFQTRLESRINATSQIIFCTTGVFLHTMLAGDGFLGGLTHLIIDEVHCRDRYTDLLLGIIRTRLSKFPGLRLILLSSSVSCNALFTYFFKCPVVKISSSVKPNMELFLEEILTCTKFLAKQDDPSEAFLVDAAATYDSAIAAAWLSGTEEVFIQLINWVIDGTMPVDYQHRLTGITLLMAATIHGRTDIVKSLLSHGADPTMKLKGLTLFDIASEFARPEMADLLQTYSDVFHAELGSNIVDTMNSNFSSTEDGSSAFYTRYSKDHVNLDLVIEVIGFALGYTEPGTILVILPGYSEMLELRDMINSNHPEMKERVQVLVLHSYLHLTDYNKLFKPAEEGKRKVILATSMVESAVSFDDVSCVVDSGLIRDRENDSIVISHRKTSPISKASAHRRALHCRNGGIVLRLYTRSRFDGFQDFTVPEITRVQLTDVCLFARFLLPPQIRLREFFCSLPDSPPTTSVQNAIDILQQIGALDNMQKVTPLATRLVDMAVEPRLGKIILASVALRCLDPVLTIVCCLSRDDPFIIPACPEQRKAAIARKIELGYDTLSDHLSLLKAYHLWETAPESRKRQVCFENFLSVAELELIFLLRVQLIGELRAGGYIRTKGTCDIRSLNVHSESWTAIKAALTTGLYPNVGRYSLTSGGVATRSDVRAQFHYASTLLSQESKMQALGLDSYFGPPYIASSSMFQTKFRAGLLNCPWLIYQDQEKNGESSILRCSSIITPVMALLCSGHANLPTVKLAAVDQNEVLHLSEMYDGRCEPRDVPDEEEIRTVCEELNMSPISDRLVIYHQRFSEKEKRALEQGLKHFATVRIDEFLAFKTEETMARWLLSLRQRFQTILEKCMCEPGNALSPNEESVLKTVLQMLSSEDTALRLPQPSSGIGRRPTNVSSDSMIVAPDLKQEELCLVKRYETYSSPPRGHRVCSKGKQRKSPVLGKTEADSKTSARLFRNEKKMEVGEAMAAMSLGIGGRPICKSYPPRC